jgi:hypothetical protein
VDAEKGEDAREDAGRGEARRCSGVRPRWFIGAQEGSKAAVESELGRQWDGCG